MRTSRVGPIAAGLAVLGWALTGHAVEPSDEGKSEWSFALGYGRSFHTSLLSGNVEEEIDFVPVLVSWGRIFHEWETGPRLGWALEGFLGYADQEGRARFAGGATPLVLLDLDLGKKWIPYALLGIGVVGTDLDPEGFGSGFGFTPQAGVGVRFSVGDGRFVHLSYRYHHISNAGLKDENKSIDSNLLFVGYSFLR